MKHAMKSVIVSLFSLSALVSLGDVSVMASRAYVDKRTALHPVTNGDEVVGYNVGIQTNVVLAAANGIKFPEKWSLANVTNNSGGAVYVEKFRAIAIGEKSSATDACSVAIGNSAVSHGTNTITLGASGTTPSQVYIGDMSIQKAIDDKVDPLSANTNVALHIDGTDLIIRTNNVDVWKSSQSENAPIKRYALFMIHLNPDSASHPFTDIELKATTNNYYCETLMFYCASSVNGDPAKSDNPAWDHDWCRLYVSSTKVDADARRWRRIRNTTDLGSYNPRELAIIVDPALFRRGQGRDWMAESNDELIWSYARITASGHETDEDGKSPLWRPTMPVKWYATLPKWAVQTSY